MKDAIHDFESGGLSATVSEERAGKNKSYRVVLKHEPTGGSSRTLLECDGTLITDIAAVLEKAARLVEYLNHGFRYEVWREDYDPTYDPEAPDS